MRKPIIVGNWKMNKTVADAKEFMSAVDSYVEGIDACTYGIGAPFTALAACTENAKNLVIAAENCHFENNGAFTGEVSIPMLQELGVTHCIIGHSERREYFGETDEAVNKKVIKLLEAGMTPIMCCGETAEEFDAGKTEEKVGGQIRAGLANLTAEQVAKVVVAYEPIWAIGTGKSATKEIAENCCKMVRDVIRSMYGDAADEVRIQYGGSVKTENIADYMAEEDIDGALIGGASLKVDSFKAIIDATK